MSVFQETTGARGRPIWGAICGLMVLATAAFAVASLVHFGVTIAIGPVMIDDPFKSAAIPEAIIAVVLGIGSISAITRWPAGWRLALATALFALLVTIYGLTVTMRSSRTSDITYHVAILVVLVVIVGLLLLAKGRHRRDRRQAGLEDRHREEREASRLRGAVSRSEKAVTHHE